MSESNALNKAYTRSGVLESGCITLHGYFDVHSLAQLMGLFKNTNICVYSLSMDSHYNDINNTHQLTIQFNADDLPSDFETQLINSLTE